MTTAIVQFDNRPQSGIGAYVPLMELNSKYALRQGYSYCYIDEVDIDLPPYWLKPFVVAWHLRNGFDTVLWLDTDAVVHREAWRIESLFNGDEALVYSTDAPPWNSPFNAGVFACREHALPLLDEWSKAFPGDQWFKDNDGSWKTIGAWSGPAYEQGAFCETILPKYHASGLLRAMPWRALQGPYPTDESLTLHFASFYKCNITPYVMSRNQKTL